MSPSTTDLVLFSALVCSWLIVGFVSGYNIDVSRPTVLRGPLSARPQTGPSRSAYFGFSVALVNAFNQSWLLVGSPRANVRGSGYNHPGGALYRCAITDAHVDRVCHPDIVETNLTVGKYQLMDDNDNWLGVNVAVRQTGENVQIVTCGHRFRIISKRINGSLGLCLNATLQRISNSLPHSGAVITVNSTLVQIKYAEIDPIISCHGQIGTSLHIVPDGRAMMGIPGLQHGLYDKTAKSDNIQGGVAFDNDCMYNNKRVEKQDQYFGYSVTSIQTRRTKVAGGFLDSYVYAGGDPRHSDVGQVVLFKLTDFGSNCHNSTRLENELYGDKYMAYFGATLCAVDVNGDDAQDLLVGAPYYNQTVGDEGIVYVYINTKNSEQLYQFGIEQHRNVTLTGRRRDNVLSADARFGTAIASMGDVNLDGFNDVAVGAPNENEGRGAVYIYHGSRDGLRDIYVQRLSPVDLHLAEVIGFGRSLTAAVDVDNNNYPDLAVGAYVSDSAVILRSRPIHTVGANFRFSTSAVEWNVQDSCRHLVDVERLYDLTTQGVAGGHRGSEQCERVDNVGGGGGGGGDKSDRWHSDTAICFNLTISFNYSAPKSDPVYQSADTNSKLLRSFLRGVRYNIAIDSHIEQSTAPDANGQMTSEAKRGYLVRRNTDCAAATNQPAYVEFDPNTVLTRKPEVEWIAVFPRLPKNVDDPVVFRVSITGPVDAEAAIPYDPTRVDLSVLSPILNPLQENDFYDQVIFYRDCGDDSVCRPELKLAFTCTGHVTIGRGTVFSSSLDVTVVISNSADTAYSTWVSFDLPTELQFASSSGIDVNCFLDKKPSTNQNNSSLANISEATTSAHSHDVTCELYRPISSNSTTFTIKLDVGGVPQQATDSSKGIRIQGYVGTHAKTSDDGRGPFNFTAPVAYDSNLRVSGSKSNDVNMKHDDERPKMVVINGQESQLNKPYLFVHKFEVTNDGPGSMPDNLLVVDVQVPTANFSSQLLSIVSVEMIRRTSSTGSDKTLTEIKIEGSWIDDREDSTTSLKRVRREDATNAASVDKKDEPSVFTKFLNSVLGRADPENLVNLKFSCDESSYGAMCRTMRFPVESLLARDQLEIRINVSVRLDLWLPIKNIGKLQYSSNVIVTPGRVIGLAPAGVAQFDKEQSKITTSTTTNMIATRPPAPMPVWVIPASIGIGLLVVILCMVVLNKCGFFRRRQHEKLQREKRESARLPLSDDENVDESTPIDGRTASGSCLDVSGKENGSRVPSEYDNDADPSLSIDGYRPENISKFGAREQY